MLTENEKEWLKRRSKVKYCRWCPTPLLDCADVCADGRCPIRGGDFVDAAEFSERVAAKLADYIETLGWKGCGKHALEHARLQVEEEMDA